MQKPKSSALRSLLDEMKSNNSSVSRSPPQKFQTLNVDVQFQEPDRSNSD